MFAILPGGGYSLKIFMPVGEPFEPSLWSSLTFYQSGRPAVAENGPNGIFSAQGGGLKRKLDGALSADRIDKLKQPDSREHFEVWVRWDFRAIMLEPDSFHIPRYRQQIDPASEGAAEAMNAYRQPTSAGEYHKLKAKERAERDAKAEALKAGKDLPKTPSQDGISGKKLTPAESREDAPGSQLAETGAIVKAEAVSAEAEPALPAVMSPEQLREKKRTRAKLARGTRSKVRADKANAASAKAWSDKRVKQLEAAGKL